MRVLVIGGTRFIGPHVVRRLVVEGHEVTVYHRGHTEVTLPAAVRHVRDPRAARPVMSFPSSLVDEEPGVVIHMIPVGRDDAEAAMRAFAGRAGRFVAVSSGDVYLAYGRFTGLEPGPVETGMLTESSPLRSTLYLYRSQASSPDDWLYSYEKILVERAVLAAGGSPRPVIVRLPKVYGPGDNADLASVIGFRDHPDWRWTHGYVENVADTIVLAALHPAARGIYNVGEMDTPAVGDRIAALPKVPDVAPNRMPANFDQHIVYDTTRIRTELGYAERVDYREGLRRTLGL